MNRPQRHPGGSWTEMLVRMLVLVAAWVLLWRVSALMEYAPHASIWFPPAALTLAAFLVMGWRAAPAIALAAMIVTFWTDIDYGYGWSLSDTLSNGALFALCHGGSFWAGAALLRWLGERSPRLSLPTMVIAFLVVGSVSALLAALLGVESLRLTQSLDSASAFGLWLPWWIGDMAAVVALTPLFAGLMSVGRQGRHRRRPFPLIELPLSNALLGPWAIKLSVLLGMLVGIMALTGLIGEGELMAFAVFFLILPQMWITYTESAFRVSLSLAAFSAMTALGVGMLDLQEYAMVYQFAITVIAATTWFGLSVPTLVEQNRRLRELAEADELTKVTGRRHFFERAREELAFSRQRGEPISLIVFDIDRFKEINDRYGHTRGDRALIEVTDVVRQHLRDSDLFGRFGGDEFMLMMTGCTARQAHERAERIRRALHEVRSLEGDVFISGTFSVVELGPDEGLSEAFDRADAGLLGAKREGRDRVVYGESAAA